MYLVSKLRSVSAVVAYVVFVVAVVTFPGRASSSAVDSDDARVGAFFPGEPAVGAAAAKANIVEEEDGPRVAATRIIGALARLRRRRRPPRPNPPPGRFLQNTATTAPADEPAPCSAEAGAMDECSNALHYSLQERRECLQCLDGSGGNSVPTANVTCEAYASDACRVLSACPCLQPCAPEVADFLACALVHEHALACEAEFQCDISCGPSASSGGGTAGTSDGGVGRRTLSKNSATTAAVSAAALVVSAAFLAFG